MYFSHNLSSIFFFCVFIFIVCFHLLAESKLMNQIHTIHTTTPYRIICSILYMNILHHFAFAMKTILIKWLLEHFLYTSMEDCIYARLHYNIYVNVREYWIHIMLNILFYYFVFFVYNFINLHFVDLLRQQFVYVCNIKMRCQHKYKKHIKKIIYFSY